MNMKFCIASQLSRVGFRRIFITKTACSLGTQRIKRSKEQTENEKRLAEHQYMYEEAGRRSRISPQILQCKACTFLAAGTETESNVSENVPTSVPQSTYGGQTGDCELRIAPGLAVPAKLGSTKLVG
jgi:hypothetical protein